MNFIDHFLHLLFIDERLIKIKHAIRYEIRTLRPAVAVNIHRQKFIPGSGGYHIIYPISRY